MYISRSSYGPAPDFNGFSVSCQSRTIEAGRDGGCHHDGLVVEWARDHVDRGRHHRSVRYLGDGRQFDDGRVREWRVGIGHPVGRQGPAAPAAPIREDAEAARDLWKRALEVCPTHANAAISLAALLVQKDQDACGAEALLCRALDAEPDNIFALTNYAILLDRQMGQPDRADEMYRRALQACPDEPSVLHNYQAFLERRQREANE